MQHKNEATKLPTIQELRESVHMNKTQFAEHLEIPYRSIQNWELGVRQCPDYVIRLIEYRLQHEFNL